MRNAWAYTMVMLYLMVVLRPAMPSLIFYANQDYYASEVCRFKDQPKNCCKGSCQLGRMARESNTADPSNPIARVMTEELLVVLVPEIHDIQPIAGQSNAFPPTVDFPLCIGNERAIWHPPTV